MSRLASARGRHSGQTEVDVDLKPIMGLICILIPLLIYAFTFYEIKIQPVSAPKLGPPNPAEMGEEQKKPLNLTVLISEKGFAIKQEKEVAGEDSDIKIPKRQVRGEGGAVRMDFDYADLYARLLQIKRKFRGETTINIGAADNIRWGVIARTIDAARVELKQDKYANRKDYSEAKEALDDEGRPKLMFPQVVFVVAE
ncbi:MAG: hypothetical protein GXP54_00310 [Deltaproteobacteria bacterium]|nr:hypothetical protein [Deltaproteobacteria bacterium]